MVESHEMEQYPEDGPIQRRTPGPQGRPGGTVLALGAGAAAAIVSGVIWAAIARFLNMEIGYVAIGVGLLTGFVMAAAAGRGTAALAVQAAGMAIIGLAIGKYLTIEWTLVPALAEMDMQNDDAINEAYAWQYARDNGEADLADILERYYARVIVASEGESIVFPEDPRIEALMTKMSDAVHSNPIAENKRVVTAYNKAIVSHIGIVDRIKLQASFWDLLWCGLAVYAAFATARNFGKEEAA